MDIEFLEDAIELFVLLQYGKIPFSCDGCSEQTQKENNCGGMYEEPEEGWYSKHTKKEYFSCPMSMIPHIIYQWYDKYAFIKEFNTPIKEDETSLMFWWFVKTYKRAVNHIEQALHEEDMAKSKKKR
jgi:hypothetical protein